MNTTLLQLIRLATPTGAFGKDITVPAFAVGDEKGFGAVSGVLVGDFAAVAETGGELAAVAVEAGFGAGPHLGGTMFNEVFL